MEFKASCSCKAHSRDEKWLRSARLLDQIQKIRKCQIKRSIVSWKCGMKGTASFGPAPFSQFSGPVAAWDWLHLLFVGSNHHCPFRQGTCSNASSVGQIYSKVLNSFDPSQAPSESWIKLGTATLHWKTSLSDVFHSIKRHAVKSCLHVRIGVQYFPIENCHKVGFKMDGNLYESLDVSRLLYPSYGGWDLPGCKNSWCSHKKRKVHHV